MHLTDLDRECTIVANEKITDNVDCISAPTTTISLSHTDISPDISTALSMYDSIISLDISQIYINRAINL